MKKLDTSINKPILLVTSPRTGSSALAELLSVKNDYTLYNEPSWDYKKLHHFLSVCELYSRYILKETALHLKKYYPTTFLNRDFYTILLRRRSVENQILSLYISTVRNTYAYRLNDISINDDIVLDVDKLVKSIKHIKICNSAVDKYNFKVDLELYYEDLDYNESKYLITPKPKNYVEFKNKALAIIKELL